MPKNNNVQFRRGNSSDWNSVNPVLASGEPGFETDSNRLKIGIELNWDDTNYISADSLVTTVYNNSGATISKFNVVYINGGQGNKPSIALSIANTEMTSSKTYGVTVNDIPNQSSGLVIVNGALQNLNTNVFGLNKEGFSLWLSPTVSGGLTLTKPYAPDHSVFVGTIIRSHNTQGVVEVKIQNGYELEELHNVATTGATNGQLLQYNSGSELWVPSSSGNFTSLSVNGTGVISSSGGTNNYISKFTGNSTIANSLVYDNGTNVGIGTITPTYKLEVNGGFAASTKSFRIHHPSKKDHSLEYGSLESPYHGVRLTGRDKVIKGVGTVSLPVYLKDLIHDDDTLNIQITNIKHGKTIYVDKIDLQNDRFIVKADRAKSLGELQFFWTLSGVRKDVDNLVVEKRN